jgi:hypothetical protein
LVYLKLFGLFEIILGLFEIGGRRGSGRGA